MTREHPWLMVAVIFVGLISAGVLIGYMSVNIPTELQQVQVPYQEQNHQQTNTPSLYTDIKYRDTYSTMYRSAIVINYSAIPDDAKSTWQDLREES